MTSSDKFKMCALCTVRAGNGFMENTQTNLNLIQATPVSAAMYPYRHSRQV